MSAYIKQLNAALDVATQARSEEQERAAVQAARERLTPLEDRLARLLVSIPREAQSEGLSLPTLQAALRGRWSGNCHPGDLGAALRKLGFERRRQWRGGAGFQALWYPSRRTCADASGLTSARSAGSTGVKRPRAQ
jgi:hypothetical protein